MVVSKKDFLFRNPTNTASFILKKDVLTSDLPDWVAESLHFKFLCNTGQIKVTEVAKPEAKKEPKKKTTKKTKAKE